MRSAVIDAAGKCFIHLLFNGHTNAFAIRGAYGMFNRQLRERKHTDGT
jgi:hypothetical protein